MSKPLRIGSLFAGIGGFDLAAESLGWSTAWVSEIDPFASAVLAKHFPHAPNLGDCTRIEWSHVERVNIICAGFPCQPHSLAGKRGASDDERDLWHECVRAVGVLRPSYFVGENVSGLLTSESGRFFNRVVSDLAQMGYAVEWGSLKASECGAPHQRERIFIVAYASGERCDRRTAYPQREGATDKWGSDIRREPGRHIPRLLPDWSDAIPYRGADGTVRLIPRGAVGDASIRQDDERGRGRVEGAAAERRGSDAPVDASSADDGRAEEEVARPEPSLRALADGVPDQLLRRDCGGEVEAWPTPAAQEPGNAVERYADGRRTATGTKADFGMMLTQASISYSPQIGGSLWPVTESEPGRVAKLRAIGNAVVPLWCVMGPFARIFELEADR